MYINSGKELTVAVPAQARAVACTGKVKEKYKRFGLLSHGYYSIVE